MSCIKHKVCYTLGWLIVCILLVSIDYSTGGVQTDASTIMCGWCVHTTGIHSTCGVQTDGCRFELPQHRPSCVCVIVYVMLVSLIYIASDSQTGGCRFELPQHRPSCVADCVHTASIHSTGDAQTDGCRSELPQHRPSCVCVWLCT